MSPTEPLQSFQALIGPFSSLGCALQVLDKGHRLSQCFSGQLLNMAPALIPTTPSEGPRFKGPESVIAFTAELADFFS